MKKISFLLVLILSAGSVGAADGFFEYNRTRDGDLIINDGGNTITVDGTVSSSKPHQICNKDDDTSPNYYGFEASDGSWYIMRWTVSAGADLFEYSKGSSGYSTGWTGRAGLTYASWGDTF